MVSTASWMIVRLRSPRKSNLTRPTASTSSLSYWATTESVPGARYSGQKSVSRPGAISTPPACIPTLRVRSSSGSATSSSWRTSSSFFSRSANSGSISRALASDTGLACTIGISLESWSQKVYGMSSTRPASRITALDAIVPKVAICETAWAPYVSRTYSMTFQRLSWQKSMSKSGIDTRSGFRNRSKSSA